MKKITEYEALDASDIDELEVLVNAQIKIGMQPFGNLLYAPESELKFIQPMVAYEESETPDEIY